MSAPFSLAAYAELLAAARGGGYRDAFFDRDPRAGDLFLRHDVDLSLEAALAMAEVEAAAGHAATYFLMTQSAFYNLRSRVGEDAIARLRALGHRVALHAIYPVVEHDERFDPVLAWHNPDPAYMATPVTGLVNVMEGRFTGDFARTYRSDSNQHWRRGDPTAELAAGAFPWLQLLIHPEIWAYDGTTMGETMRTFLDADRDVRLGYLRDDRIDL